MATLDKGKWAEKQAVEWLEKMQNSRVDFAFHRYPDARAARGALAAQPADYLVGNGYKAFHVEVKETAEVRRLPKKKIRQYGKLLKFFYASVEPIVPIYRSERDDWVCLTSVELFAHPECPPSFLLTELKSYPTVAELLEDYLV